MLIDKFEEQVIQNPNITAVKTPDYELTYYELNQRANALAITIMETYSFDEKKVVALLFEHGADMIIGNIAALKSNNIYVPMDINYPVKRLVYMLEHSGADIIVTNSKSFALAKDLAKEMSSDIKILKLDEARTLEYVDNIYQKPDVNDIAYILYTSGSTGNPKGVVQSHRNVAYFIDAYKDALSITSEDKMALFASFSHDAAVMDIYGALLSGATLYPLDIRIQVDMRSLIEWLKEEQITIWHSVPTLYRYFAKELIDTDVFPELRFITLGGESVLLGDVRAFQNKFPTTKMAVTYSQSESTINSIQVYAADSEVKRITIGKPIPGTRIVVVNENKKTVSPLEEGEIVVVSEHVSLGYWKDEKNNSFKNLSGIGRTYWTGDLGKLLPDGNIIFSGRKDFQVKINGFRVEPGEIENRLLELEQVKEAVVLARTDESGEKYLCAYIVSGYEIKVSELRARLSEVLPGYMVPSYFLQLESMPLTPNGKIDRKSLPEPKDVGAEYVSPRNATEMILSEIWSEVLKKEKIGVYDNFFELGGHSLKGIVLVSKIHKELDVELPLRELFKTPTISEISEFIVKAQKKEYKAIGQINEKKFYEAPSYYEASSAQKRIWLLQQIEPNGIAYNMPKVMALHGNLNKNLLEKVLSKIIARHETLRTSFGTIGESIVQMVARNSSLKINYSESTEIDIGKAIDDFIRPFDLSKAPLLRVELIKVGENLHYLLFDMHHIISDGTSLGILSREFVSLYAGIELDNLKIQYKDFSEWQYKLLKSDRILEQEKYWIEQFSEEIPLLNLPLDYVRPIIQSFDGRNLSFKLGEELTEKIRELSKENGSTLFMILLSAINILLSKYSGQLDIVIGCPIAGRTHADLENIIGMFVNTLAMRNYPSKDKTFAEFLNEVKDTAMRAYENQDYQIDDLIDKLDLRRDKSRNPLFDVLFVLQNTDMPSIEIEGLKFSGYETELTTSKVDLEFGVVELDNDIFLSIGYCVSLFKHETIERLGLHLRNILTVIVENKDVLLGDIDILSEDERNIILHKFNDTYANYPKDKAIHQVFEDQVKRVPNKIALIFNGESMTYRELNIKANQLAKVLRNKGVKPDDIVGLIADRSFEMIIGMLGILKAGGAYLPIEPDYPQQRVRFMLEDSDVNILLTQSWIGERIEMINYEKINLDDSKLYESESTDLEILNNPNDLAYVIYTSGSTGMPKGVMIEHRSVVNLAIGQKNIYEMDENDRILQFYSASFDASVEQIFMALLNGAALCLVSNDILLDSFKFNMYLHDNAITHLDVVPSFLEGLDLNGLDSLKRVVSSAEACPVPLAKRLSKRFKLFNEYGPTEATVASITYLVNPESIGSNIPIGKPITNYQTYILSDNNNLCSVGIPGELCIGGDGLARGYLKRPELTAEKFVPNPFKPGERMYLTGDLARWLPDGTIEFLGRIDHQVKIRGFRIELGEIESRLLELEHVKETVVLAREDETGDKYLCAYVVTDKDTQVSELRQSLSENLPDYMVPSYFVLLDKMPLTPSGKVNRKVLPEPEGVAGTEYVAPRNAAQEVLAAIWSDVLNKERIGIYDNFFELGGHSLKGTILISKIHKELNVELPLRELFKSPTISGISEYIEDAMESVYDSIHPAVKKDYYEASSAQKRMWLLQQFDIGSTGYNIPSVFILDGDLSKSRFELAFRELIARHEMLRTSFSMMDGVIVQRVAKKIDFEIEYVEVSEENIEEKIKEFIIPFDLSEAPLLRVGLVRIADDRHYLLLDMHHIISDGESMGIFTREFMALYENRELKEQFLQYKDFSEFQNKFLKSERMKVQEEYWLKQLSGELPVLNLPLDYARPPVQEFAGGKTGFVLDEYITGKLKKAAKTTDATLYMILLSAVSILLSKYSGQEEIIVGSPIAGRPHADLENIMGVFVNTLAMRSYPTSNKSYVEFLTEVKELALQAYENQDYQFEELVDKLNLSRNLSRNPLFDVMFTLQNMNSIDFELEGLKLSSYTTDQSLTKFDLSITAMETNDKLMFSVGYSTSLFKSETAERLCGHLRKLLAVVTENIEILLGEIDILTEDERSQLLYEFNDTNTKDIGGKTIHELFEEQVSRTPDSIALVFGDASMTYNELNSRSNQLAHMLRGKGVRSDDIVAIMVERSLEMVVGIIGILKAGGAYLPIDSEYPAERIRFMLEDSNTAILLTQSWLSERVEFDGEKITLDEGDFFEDAQSNLERINDSKSLAYVIYTSGSTGLPKGVMVEHENVTVLIESGKELFNITPNDIWTMFHSYNFDFSVWEMYGALLLGGKLIIVSKEAAKTPKEFRNILLKERVTILNQTPLAFNMLSLEELAWTEHDLSVDRIIFGGEALEVAKLKDWHTKYPDVKMINMYGITETTVHVTYKFITHEEILLGQNSVGRVLPTYSLYIVNQDLNPLPIGIAGEMLVGGSGLARGYLNRDELTAEKFVPSPFKPGERMYRTGDLARWMPDGSIEFLGRIDHQVKIRGFRIELGEIESRLRDLNQVEEVAVLAREDDSGDKYLCAYLVSKEEIVASELRKGLSETLPEYMVPSYFVQLTKIPLTSNGKLDRRALPEPDGVAGAEYVAPRTALEGQLAAIWCEVLNKERIGLYDNFFELGGHSLKGTILVSRIRKELNIELPLRELFKSPTILGISEYIYEATESDYASIEPAINIDGLVLLKKGKQAEENFFMVHSATGAVDYYIKLVENMNDKYNYWAIRYENTSVCSPNIPSIEEVASKHIEKIKELQDNGPYYISGWSIGGVIAFEVARQLEKNGDEVKFLGLYDSQFPAQDTDKMEKVMSKGHGFTVETELKLIKKVFPNVNFSEEYMSIDSVEILWEHILEDLKSIPNHREVYGSILSKYPYIEKILVGYEQMDIHNIVNYFNLVRGFTYNIYEVYIPKDKINTKINYFVAAKQKQHQREIWNDYSSKKVDFYNVEADHFSMFEDENDVKKLAESLSSVLKNL